VQISAIAAQRDRVRILIALLLVGAALWLATIIWAQDMEVMPGTMGLGLATFVGMWTLMMAAMMLPSAFTMIVLYASMVQSQHRRLGLFIGGYLLAWSLTGIPAFGLAWATGRIAADYASWTTTSAVVIFASCGLYQLTPLKDRCLRHCRTPLSHLLHYGSYRGALRDLRAGAHHGLYCLGCCWGLMALIIAFGVMNLVAMVALAGVVVLEKQWVHGEAVAKVAGVVSLLLAVAVIFAPGIAPGLSMPSVPMMNSM
jgi:predicted metal-binding membrane protein